MGKYRFETEEHDQFRKTVRKFLQREVEPYYEKWEQDRLIPRTLWKQLGEMGYLCPHVEESYGGLGLEHIAGKDIVTKVSMAKYWLTETTKNIASQCMQLHGGYGYMEDYKIARRYRNIPVAAIYAGTNEIMKSIVAKNIGL